MMLFLLPLLNVASSMGTSDQISKNLAQLFDDYVDVEYARAVYDSGVKIIEVDPQAMQVKLSAKTGEVFDAAVTALKSLKKKAVQLYKEHKWVNQSQGLKMSYSDSWDYWDGFTRPIKSKPSNKTLKVYHTPRYQHKVNATYSAIYLPVDVHDSWTVVNNTIMWTKRLDEIFRENHDAVKHISWQYLGSPTGVLRSYPASSAERGFYDVRKRPWYTAGIGSPKDILLLIDGSGSLNLFAKFVQSMALSFFELAITDTDFINVINVKDKPSFLTCLNHMMRATPDVITTLSEEIKQLTPQGKSNWTAALELAFYTLDMSRAINQSTFCERAIVLFTDRTSQKIDVVLDRLNRDRAVRVFVFSFKSEKGTIQLKKDILEDIACQNRGYYKKILNYGVVDHTMQRLIQVGNDQLKDVEGIAPTWSNSFNGSWGNSMLITATLPVVTGTSESERKSVGDERTTSVTVLGVVGVDMTPDIVNNIVSDLLPWSISSFMLNNKGYPVYHFREDKYMYSDMHVRLHKFQYTKANKNVLKAMERKMMDQKSLEAHAKSFVSSEGQERGTTWYQDQHYHLFPITGTPFSLGIINSENYPTTYIISKQEPCFNISKAFDLIATKWKNRIAVTNLIAEYITQHKAKQESEETCLCMDTLGGIKNNTIFADIILSESFEGAFKDTSDNVTQFIISNAGIVYYKHAVFETSYGDISHHDLMLYRKVFRACNGTMFVSMPYNEKINITREVELRDCNVNSCKVAVVGVQVPVALFISRVFRNIYTTGDEIQMLVDENGMIIYDSSDVATYTFIGRRFGWLTRELVKNKVYTKITYHECIEYCHIPNKVLRFLKNSAQRLTLTILKFAWDFGMFLLSQIKVIAVILMSIIIPVSSNHHDSKTACCKTYQHLQRNFSATIDKPLIIKDPSGCKYKVDQVKNTNLLLIKHVKHSRCMYGLVMSNTYGSPTNLAAIGIEKCELVHERDNISLGNFSGYGKYAQYYVQRKTCRLASFNSSKRICVKSGALNDFLWNGFLVGSIIFLFFLKILL